MLSHTQRHAAKILHKIMSPDFNWRYSSLSSDNLSRTYRFESESDKSKLNLLA